MTSGAGMGGDPAHPGTTRTNQEDGMAEKNPYFGATFAERKAIREAAEKAPKTKAVQADEVDEVENKSVAPKKATRKTAKKS